MAGARGEGNREEQTSALKYQTFISSTKRDLHEARQAVTWEILKIEFIPVGMENFSAMDERGWETIARVIDESDYYVLIVAGLCGTVDPKTARAGLRGSTSTPDRSRFRYSPSCRSGAQRAATWSRPIRTCGRLWIHSSQRFVKPTTSKRGRRLTTSA
jgi:hypothetical protein